MVRASLLDDFLYTNVQSVQFKILGMLFLLLITGECLSLRQIIWIGCKSFSFVIMNVTGYVIWKKMNHKTI